MGKQAAKARSEAIVLLSGGIDSSACVHFYSSQGFRVSTIFIDYGQQAATEEARAATVVSSYFKTPHRSLRIAGSKEKKVGVIQGRNALLFFSALAEWEGKNAGLIAIGIHAGTRYPDCSTQFISSVQNIFNIYCDGCVIASAPFVNWSKREIFEYCRSHKLPIELTYSCQTGSKKPCGYCDSCLDRKSFDAI